LQQETLTAAELPEIEPWTGDSQAAAS